MEIPAEFYQNKPRRLYYTYAEFVRDTASPDIDKYEALRVKYAEDLEIFYAYEKLLKPFFAQIPEPIWQLMVGMDINYPDGSEEVADNPAPSLTIKELAAMAVRERLHHAN